MNTDHLRAAIEAELPVLVALRHELHRIPELCYQEVRTSARVGEELDALGVAYKAGIAETGIVAHLPAVGEGHGSESRATEAVGLRADMDGLPIVEETGKAYASETLGRMHACGHDGHTTILLGAARMLSKLDERPNPVTFFFQPAEEGGGGGARMCDEGCLLGEEGGGIGPRVSRVFGLHGWPTVAMGRVATRPGAFLAATDSFHVRVCGTGGHAAYPHECADPIVAMAQVVTALQSIASRDVGPNESVIVTVGKVSGGTAVNIIPGEVSFAGTMRTISPEVRQRAKARFYALVEGTVTAMGCRAEIEWREGYPMTYNDAGLAEHFFDVARGAIGEERVEVVEHATLGGEDFSYYGQHVPACFFFLGLLPEGADAGTVPKLHQADFDFNDEAIATGVEIMCRLALARA